jgi:hypothetical protein
LVQHTATPSPYHLPPRLLQSVLVGRRKMRGILRAPVKFHTSGLCVGSLRCLVAAGVYARDE